MIAIGSFGYLGDLRLITGVFYGFWGLDLGVWGHCKVIHGFLGIFGGFFRGLRGSLCHFYDSYCTVILLIIIVLIYCSFLNCLSILQ